MFEGGDYYIKSFEDKSSMTKGFRGMMKSDTLTITPKANIRLFVDEDFYISKTTFKPMDKTLLINDDAKAKKLMLYVKGDIELLQKYEYQLVTKELSKIQFNTIKRHMAYERYNGELSGGVFSAPKHDKSKCTFDVDSLGE